MGMPNYSRNAGFAAAQVAVGAVRRLTGNRAMSYQEALAYQDAMNVRTAQQHGGEPRLSELLEDQALHLLMKRDGVKRSELMALISNVSGRLDPGKRAARRY